PTGAAAPPPPGEDVTASVTFVPGAWAASRPTGAAGSPPRQLLNTTFSVHRADAVRTETGRWRGSWLRGGRAASPPHHALRRRREWNRRAGPDHADVGPPPATRPAPPPVTPPAPPSTPRTRAAQPCRPVDARRRAADRPPRSLERPGPAPAPPPAGRCRPAPT